MKLGPTKTMNRCTWMLSLTFAVQLFCYQTLCLADPVPSQIDHYVTKEMATRLIPGVSIAVVQNGKLIYSQGYGFANEKNHVAATPRTIYPIASLSKQFTAAAAMILVQDGKLNLDTPIDRYISNLNPPPSWRAVTVRQLLNQTSGIDELSKYVNLMQETTTPRSVVSQLSGVPLLFSPGTAFRYSNTNYYLLAQIIQSITGLSDDDFIKERIFLPLHMSDSGSYNPRAVYPGRATGYLLVSGHTTSSFPKLGKTFLTGFGGIQSSALDLAKWDEAMDGNFPLTKASKLVMWTPPALPPPNASTYGFGWVLENYHGHPLIWHNGALPGSTVWMGRFVGDGLTVIVLSNLRNLDQSALSIEEFSEIGEGIAGLYVPALLPASATPPGATIDIEPRALAICKKAVSDVDSGHADPAMYTPDTARVLFPAAVDQTEALFQSLGALESCDGLYEQKKDGYSQITCRLTFASGSLIYTFILLDGTDQIAGVMPGH